MFSKRRDFSFFNISSYYHPCFMTFRAKISALCLSVGPQNLFPNYLRSHQVTLELHISNTLPNYHMILGTEPASSRT